MSAFKQTSKISAEGIKLLEPILAADFRSINEVQQERYQMGADFEVIGHDGKTHIVEVKTEVNGSKNFFIETWSRKNGPPTVRGWLFKMRDVDFLYYLFLERKVLYKMSGKALFQWLDPLGQKRYRRYREVPQKKYIQENDTYGRLVPIVEVKSALGRYFVVNRL